MNRKFFGLLGTMAVVASAGFAGQYETDDYTVDVAQIAGTGSLSQSFYAPSVVRTLDDQYVHLYFMGTHDINPDPVSDSVYLYRGTNNYTGWNNAYAPHPSAPAQTPSTCTFGCPGRILPNTSSSNTLVNDPTRAYGGPNAWRDEQYFTARRRVRLLAVRSNTPQTPRDTIYGVSTDGVNFNWYGLVKNHTATNYGFGWQELTIGTTSYWYGLIGYSIPGGARGVGAIRATLNLSSTSDIPITGIQVYTASGWQNLPVSTDPSFLWEFPADNSRHPLDIWPGIRHASLHKYGQGWEVYGAAVNPNFDIACACPTTPSPGLNEIVYKVLDISLAATPDLMFSSASQLPIEAETPGNPRCMPGGHAGSRHFPVLLDWVTNHKILYSATNDPSPQRTGCTTATFPGQYIVRTFLKTR